jgi:hypothetical protein
VFERVYQLGYFGRISEDSVSWVQEVAQQVADKKIMNWSLSAHDLLETGLKIPKNVSDHYGSWYLDSFRELTDWVEILRFGRFVKTTANLDHPTYSSFHYRSSDWQKHVMSLAESAKLWEAGILIQTQRGELAALSYSIPWDGTRKPWHKRLTPEQLFIGRQAELEAFSQMISGKSIMENNVARAFNASSLDMWWNEAIQSNTILRGTYANIKRRIGASYSERLLFELQRRVPRQKIYELIQSAQRISGYAITADQAEARDGINPVLRIDEINWLYQNKKSQTAENGSSYDVWESRDKDEPPSSAMWKRSSDFIYNDDRGKENGDFGVYITFEQMYPIDKGSSGDPIYGVKQIQLIRQVRLNSQTARRYGYFIHNFDKPDLVSRKTSVLVEGDPLSQEDWMQVYKLFQASLERGVVDSATFYNKGESVGLTDTTRQILSAAQELIQRKMMEFGFTFSGNS